MIRVGSLLRLLVASATCAALTLDEIHQACLLQPHQRIPEDYDAGSCHDQQQGRLGEWISRPLKALPFPWNTSESANAFQQCILSAGSRVGKCRLYPGNVESRPDNASFWTWSSMITNYRSISSTAEQLREVLSAVVITNDRRRLILARANGCAQVLLGSTQHSSADQLLRGRVCSRSAIELSH